MGLLTPNVSVGIVEGMTRPLKPGQPAGENHASARLTEDHVREILQRLLAGDKQADIAADFNVSRSHISHIRRGRSWAHLTAGGGVPIQERQGSRRASAKLTESDIPTILQRIESGESVSKVARSYNVGVTTISDIWHGRRWKHVPRARTKVWEDLYD